MKQLYLFLDGRSWVNIPISLIALICWIPFCSKWTRIGKDIRWLTIAVAALIFLVYWEGGSVAYAQIIAGFTYRGFITCLLLIPLILSSIQIVIRRFKREAPTEKDTSKGFSNDDFDDSQISDNLKKYASHILDKLIATNTQKHSYALGVTGSWGSGKTTFLEVLKSHVKGRAEIVIFNPWMCRTPEQVTLDFFASLRHQLSPNYRISKSIKDYARALNGISFTPFLGLSLNIHAVQGDSLYVKKKKLSDELAELPKPVIVFIDDLDRLEREEVFEVLRLIRNTADLSNLIYVVAYDKAYVRQVLEQKNIGNALAYLEKIFPVEVCLPMVEKYLIWEVLHSDIDAQASSDEFAKMLFQDFNTEDVELVLRILSTYRRAKRFARIYMLNMTYINRELQLEFNQVDLFWLILLQIHNPRAYEVLVYDPSILLKMVNNRWILKEGIIDEVKKDQSNNPHMGEGFWTSETHRLLDLLFGRNPKPLQQSVCFVENYDKYFALNISKYKLTFGELNSLLEGNDSPESIVREWIKTKNISSILYHLERVPTKEFKGKQVKRYLSAIFELGAAAGTYQYVKFKLSSQKYSTSQAENLQSIAMNWLSSEIESGDDSRLVELTGLLNWLYSPSSNERNEKSRSSIIISNKDIENLLENAMEQFLGRHPNLTALDIVEGFAPPAQSQLSGEHLNLNSLDPLDEKRILGTFFRNCCVQTDEDQETYIQAVFNVVIKHFSGKHIKPTLLEYQKAYDRAVSEYNLQSNNPQGNEYESNTNEELRFLHDSYFGTDNKLVGKVFLSRFKSECFSQDEQAVGSSPSGSETALSQEGQD
jgi:nitrite reductase (cytochrome; ammonia-forming)